MAKVKHIQCETLPAKLEPHAIYFVRSAGKIIQTDADAKPVEFGGVGNLWNKVIPVKHIALNYTPMSYSYNFSELATIEPIPYSRARSALYMNLNNSYGRVALYFHEPTDKLSYFLFKNIGNRGTGLEGDNKGVKRAKIWGITDLKSIPVPVGRNQPITNSVLLFEGELPRVTMDNLYEWHKISINYEGMLWGVVFDAWEKFSDNSSNQVAITKLVPMKE